MRAVRTHTSKRDNGTATRRVATLAAVLVAGLLGTNLVWGDSTAEALWGYEGDRGPEHWGSLEPAFAACSAGAEQSPIDLVGAQPSSHAPITFDYTPRLSTVVNNGHAIQVNVDRGSGILLDGTRYELLQFHFHQASEHTVRGARLPMEMHLVHRSDQEALAVVGVLVEEGNANAALEPIRRLLPTQSGSSAAIPEAVDVAALLPEPRTVWRYRGSLTTPPCTEGVAWIVMTEPVALSAAQVAVFGALYRNNFRPVQPLNRRVLGRE